MKKSNTVISAVLLLIFGGIAGFFLSQILSSNNEQDEDENKLLKLSYLELIYDGTKELFSNNYNQALSSFEQADQLRFEDLDWTDFLTDYLNNKKQIADSLRYLADKFEEESYMSYNLETQLVNLDSAVSNKDEQIRIYREVLETLRQEVREQYLAKISFQNRMTELNEEVETLKNKGFGVEFKNDSNIKIIYFGDIENGIANGEGFGIYETGGYYQGDWLNNKRHGMGIYRWKNGDKYEGGFINDKREGHGRYYLESGEYYVGGWKNDLRDGQGIFYDKSGKVLVNGEWKEDKIVKN